jgi:hypothetical protein
MMNLQRVLKQLCPCSSRSCLALSFKQLFSSAEGCEDKQLLAASRDCLQTAGEPTKDLLEQEQIEFPGGFRLGVLEAIGMRKV